jgi:hypothetical protein
VTVNAPAGCGFTYQSQASAETADPVSANNTASASVTVNDTQPPSITCPANVLIKTANPGDPNLVVTYPTPIAADNCSVTVVCTPASGSVFAAGSTTVNCTATDGGNNMASCSFKVDVLNYIIVDDITGETLVFDSAGNYLFFNCRKSTTPIFTGVGTVSTNSCKVTLSGGVGKGATQSVNATVNTCTKVGTATISGSGQVYALNDANVSNDVLCH